MSSLIAPFGGLSPSEVPLARAPLVQVVSQIMFPTIFSLRNEEQVAPFQERIRTEYPITEKRLVQHIELTDGNVGAPRGETIWRFWDVSRTWAVTLSTNFVALQTRKYSSRNDFVTRLTAVAAALQETINPQIVQRFGLRYVDRIEVPEFDRLHDLIKPEFVLPAGSPFSASAEHILSEAQLATEEGAQLLARWGTLKPMMTVDPEAAPAIDGPSFLLDLDMFSSEQRTFDSAALGEIAGSYARRLYAVFRFMVTKEFLEVYKGRS